MPSPLTFLFIGVSTAHSSAQRVFPRWMELLRRTEVHLQGVDLPLHAEPARYRAVVEQMRRDPAVAGALVTSHKLALPAACRDLFADLTPQAERLQEVSAIGKVGGRLVGHATDPSAGGLSLTALLGPGYFGRAGGELLCLGGGGAAAALLLHLIEAPDPDDRPRRCLLVERDGGRLAQLRALLAGLPTAIEFDLRLHDEPVRNDALLATLRPASVVINATGMGKDHPGSPLTDAVRFPERSVAWDLNYRGELRFLEQARSRRSTAPCLSAWPAPPPGCDSFCTVWRVRPPRGATAACRQSSAERAQDPGESRPVWFWATDRPSHWHETLATPPRTDRPTPGFPHAR
jgi:shikimate 5-dehydrogenase